MEHVIVDGSNIATEGRTKPSLEQLDEAVTEFVREYPDVKMTVVVDATFPNRIKSSEKAQFEKAILDGSLVTPPAGVIGRGDAFILQIADKVGAVVLSNDSFQEFHGEYPWLLDDGRVIGGKPVPEVGWVFTFRSPVQGPLSRQAQSAKKGKPSSNLPPLPFPKTPPPAPKKTKGSGDGGEGEGSKRSSSRRSGKKDDGEDQAKKKPTKKGDADEPAKKEAVEKSSEADDDRKRPSKQGLGPFNELMPFLEFVSAYPVGTEFTAEVDRFSSHGAYVKIESGVQCYVPLPAMADPAPNSPREVLTIGETRTFVVLEFDRHLRGIDVGIPGVIQPEPVIIDDPASEPDSAKKAAVKKAAVKESAVKKAAVKKAAAKKAAVKKAAVKKAAVKESAVKESAVKKAAVKKAAVKKTAAKKSAAKKSAAKKSAAKKTAGS